MRAHGDGITFANISATPASFSLGGGVYVIDAIAAWGGGSVTLQRLGPDGGTYLTAVTALTADGVSAATALPPGTYRLLITTAAGVYVAVLPIAGE